MNVLLDTRTLLWLVSDPAVIDPAALEVLSDPLTAVFVTAASAWEIAIKTRIGRLDGDALLSAWPEIVAALRATELAISADDAIHAGRLGWENKDPFDRMIVAQSMRRGLTVATRDRRILDAGLAATLPV